MHIQWQTSNTTPLSVRQRVELGVTVTRRFIKLFWKFLNLIWCITIFICNGGCNVTYNSISSLEDTNTVQIRFRLNFRAVISVITSFFVFFSAFWTNGSCYTDKKFTLCIPDLPLVNILHQGFRIFPYFLTCCAIVFKCF